jgi:DNA-binding XRE family transcriptional regulator
VTEEPGEASIAEPGTASEAVAAPQTELSRALVSEMVRLRKKRKIGQEPLAKVIGVSQGRLSQIENFKGGPMTLDAFLLYAQSIGAEIVMLPAKNRSKR